MSFSEEDFLDSVSSNVEAPVKIKLRRLGTRTFKSLDADSDNDEVIQKNLEPLKINVEKKKHAQECYYRNHNKGISPLARNTKKMPIKLRLGNIPNGTSTSVIGPRIRLHKLNSPTCNKTISKHGLIRNVAQIRLNKIRSRNCEELNQINPQRRIKLRRLTHHSIPAANNFSVQIKNNNVVNKRFRMILNSEIQAFILDLKNRFSGEQIIPQFFPPTTTTLSITDRFARLS